MKKIIIFCISAIILGSFASCNKDENTNVSTKLNLDYNWDNYDWISEASYECYTNMLYNTDPNIDQYDLIKHIFDSLYVVHDFKLPVPESISDNEMTLHYIINEYISLFDLGSEEFRENLFNLQYDNTFQSLTNEEKVRVSARAQVYIGISKSVENADFEAKQQYPRDHYNSADGDSRFERQLLNCLHYQLDGHFETISGALSYLSGIPFSAISDVVICGEEISRGWWNHVK